MGTVIKKSFSFQAAVYFQGQYIIGTYEITLVMSVETQLFYEQNIAMERIKYLLDECMSSCVFVQESEKNIIEKYTDSGLRVCTLPEEPYDQIIMMALFLKLNSITENKLKVLNLELRSTLSDDISFLCDSESIDVCFKEKSWWYDVSRNINDINKPKNKKDKIVKLIAANDWNEVDLSWKETDKESAEIIFTSEK